MLHLVLAAALAAPSPDPYQIFARASAYWLQQRYPTRVEYDVAVAVTEGGTNRVQRYDADYDAVKNQITVDPLSDYERAHPTKASGVDLSFFMVRLNKPLPPADWIGVPKLAPNYSFGIAPFVPAPTPTPFNSAALVDEIRTEFNDPNPRATPSPTPSSGLSEIATVVAHDRNYTITLLGTDVVDGHECYHLGLKPERNPGVFRIRQAWVDESTFATWKLVDATNFKGGPTTSVAWTIHFTDVGGAHYVSEEDAASGIDSRGLIFLNVALRFENIRAVAASTLDGVLMQNGTPLEEP